MKRRKLAEQPDEACSRQMFYDAKAGEVWVGFDPNRCVERGVNCGFCPLLQKDLGTAVGNVFFDVEFRGQDTSVDGALSDEKPFRRIFKGFRLYDKPVNLVWAEAALDADWEDVLFQIRYNHLPRVVDHLALFRAEQGEIDLHWEIKNVRIAPSDERNPEQDLADIANGISVTHVLSWEELKKERDAEKSRKVLNKRKDKWTKKVLSRDPKEYNVKQAIKWLGKGEYNRLLALREPKLVQTPFIFE